MCLLCIAVGMAGGFAEGIVGRCVCRVGGGCSGPDQAFRAAAADHTAIHCKCHQRGRGSHSTTQVQIFSSVLSFHVSFCNSFFILLSCFVWTQVWFHWSVVCLISVKVVFWNLMHTKEPPRSCTSEVWNLEDSTE